MRVMTPDQKAAYEAITDLIQRTAMEIAELPKDQRGAALRRARNSIAQSIGQAEPGLVEICTRGIATVLREIEASGNPSGGTRRTSRPAAFRSLDPMVNALVARRNIQLAKGQKALRAAEYIRMSTDHQKYSPENQRTAIAAYAAQRGIAIVRSYADEGRSGLTISKRDGLNGLIRDIQREQTDFNCILVYDVSRWGRFQDADESAYYEFICKRVGVTVHYCEEEFENDGSLASVLMKSVSRVEAANFSKRLSKRIFMAQSHGVSLGFWRGGTAPYGYRRQAVDKDGAPRGLLAPGQQKPFKSDRVILVPGSKKKLRLSTAFLVILRPARKTRSEIANELNAKGIPNSLGNPWQMQTIDILLRNEVYLGHNVYNRRSMKLQQRPVDNPAEMWIRRDNAFEAIIPRALFAKAQKVLSDLEYRQTLTDQEILDKLKALWRKEGHLSMKILRGLQGHTRLDCLRAAVRVSYERLQADRL